MTDQSFFPKETLIKLNSHIKPHTLIVGDFSTSFSPMHRCARQKINREMRKLTDVMTQKGLTDIYRTVGRACSFVSWQPNPK